MRRIMEWDWSEFLPLLAIPGAFLGALLWDIVKGIAGNMLTPFAERFVSAVKDRLARRTQAGAANQIAKICNRVDDYRYWLSDGQAFNRYIFQRLFLSLCYLAITLAFTSLISAARSPVFVIVVVSTAISVPVLFMLNAARLCRDIEHFEWFCDVQRKRVDRLVAKYPALQEIADAHKF